MTAIIIVVSGLQVVPSDMKVSWQVTGIRKDPWAKAHRIEVKEDKPDKERHRYIYSELYGQPADKGKYYRE